MAGSWFIIVALIAFLIGPQLQTVAPGLGGWAYLAGVAFALLLYMSVLLHEVSHAVAARAFDMQVNSIHLHFLGGATEIEGESKTPWREFVIAVVGPLTSIAIGAAAWFALDLFDDGLLHFTVGALAVANLVVGVLNLVPGLPLDGGRVLQAAVWGVTHKRDLGVTVAAWGGRVAAAAAVAWPFVVMPLIGRRPEVFDAIFWSMIGLFLWSGATQALQVSRLRARLPDLAARRLARSAIGVPADLPASEGIRRAQEARAGSLVVVTGTGEPTGIVNEDALRSTPAERLPWVSVGALARRLEDGLSLSTDLSGEALIRAMNSNRASEYVLVEPDGALYGVLVTSDVDEALRDR
ncbi:MAG: hypothetical protein AVDCRST_MAG21-653 [uncultured Nocardioidaceae bacterium]|uniref:Zinc metalloprotease n=1 Tax=uncultured Nocardioidaceae bacterium TaxID=253824 RepID=A0A6J4MVM1_9ACTN|nr:MAG: hypothetical protein AVDCRST_MAG21-653 [uncultured Nocardioidaceae bacterium]